MHSTIGVAGQNVHWEREGAFTGEVSAPMLKEAGAEYVIIGHSERRRLFGETDETVNRKLAGRGRRAADADRLHRRDARASASGNETLAVLDRQIKDGLDGLTADQIGGARRSPTSRCGRSAPAATRRRRRPARRTRTSAARLRQWFGGDAADQCHIIYGGSVKPDNIRELSSLADVDGALVGGASLDVRGFFEIVTRGRAAAA